MPLEGDALTLPEVTDDCGTRRGGRQTPQTFGDPVGGLGRFMAVKLLYHGEEVEMSRMRVCLHQAALLALGVAFCLLGGLRPLSAAPSRTSASHPSGSSSSRSHAPSTSHRSGSMSPRTHTQGGFHGGGFHGGGFHGGGRFFGGWGWYNPWWGWPYGYYPSLYRSGEEYRTRWTAVKTDVEPDEAALYLDGKLIGSADDFDGFPDRLYLGRGHYRLEFRLPGYETYSTEIDAAPGRSFRIDQHLKKVPGAKQYGTYESTRPEGGIVRFFAKRGSSAEPQSPAVSYTHLRAHETRHDLVCRLL